MKANTDENRYLYELIHSVLESRPPAVPPPHLDWEALCRDARARAFFPFICYGLEGLDESQRPDPALLQKIRKEQAALLIREARQRRALRRLLRGFDRRAVKCLLDSALSLKNLYPYPELRRCDEIELFIEAEALPAAREILQDVGFSASKTSGTFPARYLFDDRVILLKDRLDEKPLTFLCEGFQKYKDYLSVYEWRPEALYRQLTKKMASASIRPDALAWPCLDLKMLRRFYPPDNVKKTEGSPVRPVEVHAPVG